MKRSIELDVVQANFTQFVADLQPGDEILITRNAVPSATLVGVFPRPEIEIKDGGAKTQTDEE